MLTNPNKGKWFKFNDTVVEEFDMTDTSVEQECFGGVYKAKVFDSSELGCACVYVCVCVCECILCVCVCCGGGVGGGGGRRGCGR